MWNIPKFKTRVYKFRGSSILLGPTTADKIGIGEATKEKG